MKRELYRLNVVDKAGLPLTAAKVELSAYRPSDASADFKSTLTEVDAGIYEGYVTFPLKGIWEINVDIIRADDRYDFYSIAISALPTDSICFAEFTSHSEVGNAGCCPGHLAIGCIRIRNFSNFCSKNPS